MLENGFIKLYRNITKWEWYDDIITSRVFIHLLLTVNYETAQWHGIPVGRGQRIYSREKLSGELNISVQKLRTAISHLQSTGEITISSHPKYSVVTVNNYDTYQTSTSSSSETKPTDNQLLTGNQPDSNHNERKIKNPKKEKELKEYYSPLESPQGESGEDFYFQKDISLRGEESQYAEDDILDKAYMKDELKTKVREWLEYKRERGEVYKPTGLKSLVSQIEKMGITYGEFTLIELINTCMSNGYKGITFDKLESQKSWEHEILLRDQHEAYKKHKGGSEKRKVEDY